MGRDSAPFGHFLALDPTLKFYHTSNCPDAADLRTNATLTVAKVARVRASFVRGAAMKTLSLRTAIARERKGSREMSQTIAFRGVQSTPKGCDAVGYEDGTGAVHDLGEHARQQRVGFPVGEKMDDQRRSYDSDHGMVKFSVMTSDGKQIPCTISEEALGEYGVENSGSGSGSKDAFKVFDDHRESIRRLARAKLDAGEVNAAEGVDIVSGDRQRFGR